MTGTKEFAVTTTLATNGNNQPNGGVKGNQRGGCPKCKWEDDDYWEKDEDETEPEEKDEDDCDERGTMDSIENTVIITDTKIKEDRLRAYRIRSA